MKHHLLFALSLALASPALAQDIDFGDDTSDYANDGYCDDRRFTGNGMAISLDWEDLAKDASDCAALYDVGSIRLWIFADAVAATQCTAIDWGNDDGDYPFDGRMRRSPL